MTNRLVLIIAFASTVFAPTAHAQEPVSESQAVIAEVMLTDGVLTEDLHRRFWDAQRRLAPPGQEQEAATAMLKNLMIAQEYQHEMWQSIRDSFNRQQPVRSDRLDEIRSMLASEFERSLPWPEGSPDYIAAMSAYQTGLRDSDANLEVLLAAAAAHESVITDTGETIDLSLESIDAVLAGQEAAFERLERLFDPVWTDATNQEQEE